MMAFSYTHYDDEGNLLEFGADEWRFGIWFDDTESGWYFVSNGCGYEWGDITDEIKEFMRRMVNDGLVKQ
jgi:hypothetical protein